MFQEDEEDNDIGKHRFLLCCILNNLHVLSNIMLPVCAHNHFAQYIVSCIKKKRKKKISQSWKKKQIIYCSLLIAHRLIICLEGEAKSWTAGPSINRDQERWMKHTQILLIKCDKNRNEKNTSINIQHYYVNGAFIGY